MPGRKAEWLKRIKDASSSENLRDIELDVAQNGHGLDDKDAREVHMAFYLRSIDLSDAPDAKRIRERRNAK